MKPAQWMAVLILALMVGGITFVMVYLGNNRDPAASAATTTTNLGSLTFVQKKYPEEGERPPITEVNQSGYQDFWFVNESDQDVQAGLLNKMDCTCTHVELAIAPDSWRRLLVEETAGQVSRLASALTPGGLEGLRAVVAAYAPELSEKDVEMIPLDREKSVKVPAGALGWVRLNWQRRDAKPFTTWAELWMGQRSDSFSAHLQASVLIVPPMQVKTEVSAGVFNFRDLEKGQRKVILCWSATRPSFSLKVEQIHDRVKAESDAIEVGQPIPLTADELRHIEQSEKLPVEVLSGYRIPVSLNARGKDGTPIEWGHFRRYVKLSSTAPGIEETQVKVTGTVQGDVKVGDQEGGLVNLGPFFRGRGARGDIKLQTDVKDLELELDTSRVPEYLKVRFPKEPDVSPGGHREWLLEVEVPPNTARGEFPRTDDPVYSDSAIYVKTKNMNPPRTIRVPIRGTANES